MITYKQQFDKITEAYIKDEIRPFDAKFCFCGTIDGTGEGDWILRGCYLHQEFPYTYDEFRSMEKALFDGMGLSRHQRNSSLYEGENYEEDLFNGMCKALDRLKKIHISRGEVIDGPPVFTKRKPKNDVQHKREEVLQEISR